MALTDAQKRANAADIARRKALGDVKVTVWLSARAKVRLDELTARHGTRQKALEAALAGLDPGNGRPSIKRIEPGPVPTWPSGALIEPRHKADPGLTLGSVAVVVKPVQVAAKPVVAPYGSRLKKR